MDIYTILDVVAVSVAVLVCWKVKSTESLLLAGFFALTSMISLILFNVSQAYDYDVSRVWLYAFTGLPVIFGLMSENHPIVLGYIAYLVTLGMNEISPLEYYSVIIYSIYAFQLFVVFYVRDSYIGGHRNHLSTSPHDQLDG